MTEEQFKEYFSSEGGLTRNKQEQISKEVSSVALYLLRNYRFVIKSSFLDVHPLEAYQKMCGYLLTKRSRLITEPFQKPRFSGQILRESFVLVPILSEMRNRFLVT